VLLLPNVFGFAAEAPNVYLLRMKDQSLKTASANFGQGISAATDLVSILRGAQAFAPLGAILRAAGATLVASGLAWGGLRLVSANPFVLLVFIGLVCLVASLATDRDGLLIYLPEGVQELLLKKTVFDFVYDDTAFTNLVRKWGRVQLLALQDGRSEGDIQQIVDSMDPTFLDMVLRRSFIHFLPLWLLRLLLPEAAFSGASVEVLASASPPPSELVGSQAGKATSSWPQSFDAARPTSSSSSSSRSVKAATVLDTRSLVYDQSSPITVPWVMQMLREKMEEKQRLITEPDIVPLVISCSGLESKLKSFGRQALFGFKAFAAAAASGWCVAAGLLYFGAGSRYLVRGLAASGVMSRTPGDEQLARASRWATAFSLLSAGGTIALAAYAGRISSLLEDGSSLREVFSKSEADGGSDARSTTFEPEREESPADSEVSTEELR